MEILGIFGTIVSILSGAATWYWGTKKKRLIKAIDEQQKKIKTIEDYVSGTGYKLILRDCFHSIAYSFSIVFVTLGVSILIYSVFPSRALKMFLIQISSCVLLASGLILFDLFRVLSKTFKPKENLDAMSHRLNKLKEEHGNS